jgi:hypothetical protein
VIFCTQKITAPGFWFFVQKFHNKLTLCSRVFGDLEKEPTKFLKKPVVQGKVI